MLENYLVLDYEVETKKAVLYCNNCGSPIYEGENYYCIDGFDVCSECINDQYLREAEVF